MSEETSTIDLFGNIVTSQQTIPRELLAKMLYDNLKDISLEDLVNMLTTKFNAIIEYAELLDGKNACQRTSLLFNPHRLDTKTLTSEQSIYESIKQEKFSSGFARAILFSKKHVDTHKLLYHVIQLGINGVQYVNEFPPHVARELYKEHRLSKESKILDPCAGWGGRMLGASAVTDYYEAFEPCSATHKGLIELSKFINSMNTSFVAKVHKLPFEDAVLEDNFYDFALTSPPYFNTEKYSCEETDSATRYKNFENWCEKFFIPLIEKTMEALKPDATFVLNIGSRKYPLNDVLLSNFGGKYQVSKGKDRLSGIGGGLGKKGEGETFYYIKKTLQKFDNKL